MNWFPRLISEELAVNYMGDMMLDGRDQPLLRGASNYYCVFYAIAWFGFALPVWQGAIHNSLTGKRIS